MIIIKSLIELAVVLLLIYGLIREQDIIECEELVRDIYHTTRRNHIPARRMLHIIREEFKK